MATISLYKNKINGVGGLIDSIVKSSNKLDTQLGTLRNTLQGVDSSTCNLQSVVSSISSSSKSEKEKVADLKRLNSKLTDFITMTARRDADAKSAVERSKNDFYSKYSYLKPECEKNVFEHICDGIATAAKWCKEHWKLIVTAIIVVVAVVLICTGVGGILGAMALGALLGALIGGGVGGTLSVINGGSFLDGFEDGAFSGAIAGIITGGLGFSLSAGGTVALSLGQTMGIGGISSAGASLFGDIGDVLVTGKNLSISQIFMNMTIAGLSGAAFAGICYGISKGISTLKIKHSGNTKPPKLPDFDGKKTIGVFRDTKGNEIRFESGGISKYKNVSSTHAEGKAATYMRENGLTKGIIFHNNPNGTCNYCDKGLATLLPENATLEVIPPANASAPNKYWIDVPKTYIGNNKMPKIKKSRLAYGV